MFSNSTKYAIRTIEHLLNCKNNVRCKVSDIANELEIPNPFLSKIMQQLAKSNIVSSVKGRNGGFYLSAENKMRPLIDVVVCIEGRNVFNECVLGLPECTDEKPCVLHTHFKIFKTSIEKDICKGSIKELLKDM